MQGSVLAVGKWLACLEFMRELLLSCWSFSEFEHFVVSNLLCVEADVVTQLVQYRGSPCPGRQNRLLFFPASNEGNSLSPEGGISTLRNPGVFLFTFSRNVERERGGGVVQYVQTRLGNNGGIITIRVRCDSALLFLGTVCSKKC